MEFWDQLLITNQNEKKEEEAIFGPDYLFRYWDCRKAIRSSYIGYGKGTNWGNKNKNDFRWTGSGNMIAIFWGHFHF